MNGNPLRIVHCFRSPIGGVFRHVRDLATHQAAAGHSVGIICDSSTGAAHEDRLFEEIKPALALGLKRVPMVRAISPYDLIALMRCAREIRRMAPDILHLHSAKGGTYGRMAAYITRSASGKRPVTLYCPHGGAMHYDKGSLKGKLYFTVERQLERATDSLIFVSEYEKKAYYEKVGPPRCDDILVYNGLSTEEFEPVLPAKDACHFLYIGMMRDLKGPDLFLKAFALARQNSDRNLTTGFIGDGPDKDKYIRLIAELGLEDCVFVEDAMPARQAFTKGKVVVVPSRAESMPYLVLETIAASKPIVSTNVGGLPEIFNDRPELMVDPDNVEALSRKMLEILALHEKDGASMPPSPGFRKRFSLDTMANAIEQTYRRFHTS